MIAEITRVGYKVQELRIVNDRGRRAAGFGTKLFTELTGGRYVTLPRSELSRLLFEKIKDTAEVVFDDEIVGLKEQPDCVGVQLKHSGERHFDLVIGADGLHSAVRKLTFGASQQLEKTLGYIVAAFEARGFRPRDEDVYLMYGQPGRMVGRFTLRDDQTLFLFVFAVDGDRLPSTLDQQKAMLHRKYAAGRWECPAVLAELDRATELYFDRISQIRMRNWSKGRVALIGDAAFCVSLLAGQGSALAMISAYVLAGELAEAGGRYQQAFYNYEARLRPFIEMKQRGAERFAGAFVPKTRWGLGFRNQVIRAFAIPGLATLAIGREINDNLQLPEYDFRSFQHH